MGFCRWRRCFYLSSNGENTIQHFTSVNSPLPSDIVTDIKVDSKTGKVYFATGDGVVVYQGDVLNVTSNFGNVKVYPNPVITSQFRGNVKITGLAEKPTSELQMQQEMWYIVQ